MGVLDNLNIANKYSLDLILLLLQVKRDTGTEQNVIQNLKNYFNNHLFLYTEKYDKNLKRGIFLFVFATSLMVINSIKYPIE